MIVYAETGAGSCLREAKSVDAGRRAILKNVGTSRGVTVCRKATKKDVDWIRGMGGFVPPGAEKLK